MINEIVSGSFAVSGEPIEIEADSFAVSFEGEIVVEVGDIEAARAAFEAQAAQIENDAQMVGIWVNPADGKVYIDRSEQVSKRDVGRIAVARNQRAAFSPNYGLVYFRYY